MKQILLILTLLSSLTLFAQRGGGYGGQHGYGGRGGGYGQSHNRLDRGDQVIIYNQQGYRGGQRALYGSWSAGHYNGPWNDAISSIYIPAGYQVIAYEHAGYRGRSIVLTNNWCSSQSYFGFNNYISSIQIIPPRRHQPRPVAYGGVVLYSDIYGGRQQVITNNWNACNVWYDQVSSIVVPRGYEVIAYTQPNYRGRSMRLTNNWAYGGGACHFNNQIRSIQIVRTPGYYGGGSCGYRGGYGRGYRYRGY